ncbi:MAG: hypothetical protein AAF662_11185, partial [Pseudomonadota bacterium]
NAILASPSVFIAIGTVAFSEGSSFIDANIQPDITISFEGFLIDFSGILLGDVTSCFPTGFAYDGGTLEERCPDP